MERHRFRSGSPKHDLAGFSGTVLGKHVRKVSEEATLQLQQVARDMSMNEAATWLKANYPEFAGMMRVSTFTMFAEKANRSTPFSNSQKKVTVGSP